MRIKKVPFFDLSYLLDWYHLDLRKDFCFKRNHSAITITWPLLFREAMFGNIVIPIDWDNSTQEIIILDVWNDACDDTIIKDNASQRSLPCLIVHSQELKNYLSKDYILLEKPLALFFNFWRNFRSSQSFIILHNYYQYLLSQFQYKYVNCLSRIIGPHFRYVRINRCE